MKHILLLDTETTNKGYVWDIGYMVLDKKGNIISQKYCILREFAQYPLFSNRIDKNFSSPKQAKKQDYLLRHYWYDKVSVKYINKVFESLVSKYPDIVLSAYNLPFDMAAMRKSGIHVEIFNRQLCLYKTAKSIYANRNGYNTFCKVNGYETAKGNVKLSAEILGRYLYNNTEYKEGHYSLDDLRLERDILINILRQKKKLPIKVV